jgi:P27 family predicted phage terminase small subunit
MPTVDPAGPPDDLSAPFRALYRRVRTAMQAQGTWENTDQYLLGLYVRVLERAALARSSITTRGNVVQLTTTGSKGNPIPHPAVKIARDAERDAEEYAKELLITPRARKQYEIEARTAGSKFGFD